METKFARVDDVAEKTFDYIVVGGGTSGSVVAARLSEDPEKSILLLEAGKGRVNDYFIDKPMPALWLNEQLGNADYEWLLQTTPQRNVADRVIGIPIGKGLGGSSNINMQAWLRPGREEVDAWEKFGNQGWGYKDLLPCIQRSERFHHPSAQAVEDDALAEDQSWYGKNGPISISYCEFPTGLDKYTRTTAENRGIPRRKDHPMGDYTGYWSNPASIDPETNTRSTAFKGYILPNLGRRNLTVLTEAEVTKVLTKTNDSPKDNVPAEGVEFVVGGKRFIAYAAKEILLCAGAIKTPQILELSGIGNPNILKPLGVPVLVDLPGVGEKLQDHYICINLSFELSPEFEGVTLDILRDPKEYEKQRKIYDDKQLGPLSFALHEVIYTSIQSISPKVNEIIACHEQEFTSRIARLNDDPERANWLKEQLNIQLASLKNPNYPEIQYLFFPYFLGFTNEPEPGKKYFGVACCMVMPWSRGTTHITSADPLQKPEIDMNVFDNNIELDILVEAFKWARQLKDHEPLKSIIAKEVVPGSDKLVTDEEIREELKKTVLTFFHLSGTASMVPRDKLGVVDSKLKVYGTNNIRVCDYSIAPIGAAVHSQCTVYGIAERAVEIIKADA